MIRFHPFNACLIHPIIRLSIVGCRSVSYYSEDLEYYAAPFATQGKALEILNYKLYAWPGHGLSVNPPNYQYVEDEYMKAEEHKDLNQDEAILREATVEDIPQRTCHHRKRLYDDSKFA
jgi:hypothetical protein